MTVPFRSILEYQKPLGVWKSGAGIMFRRYTELFPASYSDIVCTGMVGIEAGSY